MDVIPKAVFTKEFKEEKVKDGYRRRIIHFRGSFKDYPYPNPHYRLMGEKAKRRKAHRLFDETQTSR